MTKKKSEDFSFSALVAVKTKEEAATKLHNYIDFVYRHYQYLYKDLPKPLHLVKVKIYMIKIQ